MPFDFETVLNRRHTNAVKWDVADDELPMWVADMDFETAPVIKQALIKRA
ncbi:MAG: plastocyanin, partial [Lactiplantibacillus argentoratensis]